MTIRDYKMGKKCKVINGIITGCVISLRRTGQYLPFDKIECRKLCASELHDGSGGVVETGEHVRALTGARSPVLTWV